MRVDKSMPHVSFEALRNSMPGSDAYTPEFVAILDEYLKSFTLPSDLNTPKPRRPCLKCGSLYAGFTWSIQHGEGHCSECGWPARAYHFITDETGAECRLVMTLQYHPIAVTVRRKRKAKQK